MAMEPISPVASVDPYLRDQRLVNELRAFGWRVYVLASREEAG
jgi:hypothetical protein